MSFHAFCRTIQRRGRILILYATLVVTFMGANNTFAQSEDPEALVSSAAEALDRYSGDSSLLKEATVALIQAVEIDPQNVQAYVEMARLVMKSAGRPGARALSQAEELILHGLSIDPEHGNSYVLLGHVLTQQKRLEEAQAALDKARELNATSPWLNYNIAEMLKAKGETQAAMLEFNRVADSLELPARVRANALQYLGSIHQDNENYNEAKQAFLRGVELVPDQAWPMGNYSRFLRTKFLDTDESEVWGRRALSILDYRWGRKNLAMSLYLKWAEALITDNDYAQAEIYFEEASALHDNLGDILYEIPEYPHAHPIVDALLVEGYSLDNFNGLAGGTTPLILAADNNNINIVKQLVESGANVDQPGFRGSAPLMIAANRNHLDMIQLLLSMGANPHMTDAEGNDAQKYAEKNAHGAAVRLIREAKMQAPEQISVRNSLAPFRTGYVYLVKRDIRPDRWGMDFSAGEKVLFKGSGNYSNRNIAAFNFTPLDNPSFIKDWGIEKDKLDEWPHYFEEIGPAESYVR